MFKIIFLFSLLGACINAVEFEKYFKICNRNAPDLNECMADAVRSGKESMINGIEDPGIPPLDPYRINELTVEYGANEVTAKMKMYDIDVAGLNNATVEAARVRAGDDHLELEVDLKSPFIRVSGRYEGEGKFNAIKLAADGDFICLMTDVVFTWKLAGTTEEKDGKTYIKIKSFKMRPDIGNMVTELTNNNAESKGLVASVLPLMNQNWKFMYQTFLPDAEKNWGEIGVNIANLVFQQAPYDAILPNA